MLELWNRTYALGDKQVIEQFRTLLENKNHGADWDQLEKMLPPKVETADKKDIKQDL